MITLDTQVNGLWVVTLDRPDKANALTEQMLTDLIDVSKEAHGARALVLTGRGKVFSAGADLDAARAGLATSPLWEQLSGAIAELPGLTIAALNGTLAGGAMGMALACDLRICVPSTKFFYPVMKHGFLPQPSDPIRMANLIGPSRAKLVLLAGQKLTSEQALDFGLVDQVVPNDALIETAHSLATDVLDADPKIAQQIKALCP